jgi:trehalose-phosphatase
LVKIIQPGIDLDQFFLRLARAPQRALLLDYDGTLAPFHVERDQAVLYPNVRAILNTLLRGRHTRLVIISGRAVHDLLPLLELAEPVEVWGSHGWERWTPGGRYQIATWSEQFTCGLVEAGAWAEHYGFGEQCERKPAGLALHWRGLTHDVAGTLRERAFAQWTLLAQQTGLDLHSFDGGVELRVPGRDKGTVVETILQEQDGTGTIAYAGDDLTDEEAFKALSGRGLNILVRRELRPTAADLWIQPPDELVGFLERWHQSCAYV